MTSRWIIRSKEGEASNSEVCIEGGRNTVWGTEKNSEGSKICLGKKCEKVKPIWFSFSCFSIAEL